MKIVGMRPRVLRMAMLLVLGLSGCGILDVPIDPSVTPTAGEAAASTIPPVTPVPSPTDDPCPGAGAKMIRPANAAELQPLARFAVGEFPRLSVGDFAAIGSQDGIQLITLECPELAARRSSPAEGLISLQVWGDRLVGAYRESGVYVWQSPTLELLQTFETQPALLAVDRQGEELVVASAADDLELWHLGTGDKLHATQLEFPIAGLGYAPDGSRLAVEFAADLENPLLLWGIDPWGPIAELGWAERSGPLYAVTFAPDWSSSAWVSRATVLIQDPASGETQAVLGHEEFIDQVGYSPDGLQLAVASAASVDGDFLPVVAVWDIASQTLRHLLVHQSPIGALAFSPAGDLLATLSDAGDLYLWDLGRGELIKLVHAHEGQASGLGFARHGEWLISLGMDGTAIFWGTRR